MDLAAVVFTSNEGALRQASPLMRLDDDRLLQAEFRGDLGEQGLVLGFERQMLQAILPAPAVYERQPLQTWDGTQGRLPVPSHVWRATEDGTLREVDVSQAPPLTADWVGTCQLPTLFMDTDCQNSPCSLSGFSDGAPIDCSGRLEAEGCTVRALDYVFDASGRWLSATLRQAGDVLPCASEGSPSPGAQRMRCRDDASSCQVDLYTERSPMNLQVENLQLLDVQPQYPGPAFPPHGGYITGLAPGPSDGEVWVAHRGGGFTDVRCDRARPAFVQRMGPDPVTGAPTPRGEPLAAPDCLHLLRSAEDGGFFGAFLGPQERWHWGYFDPAGRPVRSVPLTDTAVPRFTATAANRVDGRWVVALTDLRSREQRAEEDGTDGDDPLVSQGVSVRADAGARLVGPKPLAFQRSTATRVYALVEDADGNILFAVEDDELHRADPETLGPVALAFAPSIGTTPGVGRLESEPHHLFRIPGRDGYLALVTSSTRYGEDGVFRLSGVVHRLEDDRHRSSHFFLGAPADATRALPFFDRPELVLMGMHLLDEEATMDPERQPQVRAILARFDLRRPGFEPAWVEVGDGPVTHLVQAQDGSVWGTLGWSGQVIRAWPAP